MHWSMITEMARCSQQTLAVEYRNHLAKLTFQCYKAPSIANGVAGKGIKEWINTFIIKHWKRKGRRNTFGRIGFHWKTLRKTRPNIVQGS